MVKTSAGRGLEPVVVVAGLQKGATGRPPLPGKASLPSATNTGSLRMACFLVSSGLCPALVKAAVAWKRTGCG